MIEWITKDVVNNTDSSLVAMPVTSTNVASTSALTTGISNIIIKIYIYLYIYQLRVIILFKMARARLKKY